MQGGIDLHQASADWLLMVLLWMEGLRLLMLHARLMMIMRRVISMLGRSQLPPQVLIHIRWCNMRSRVLRSRRTLRKRSGLLRWLLPLQWLRLERQGRARAGALRCRRERERKKQTGREIKIE